MRLNQRIQLWRTNPELEGFSEKQRDQIVQYVRAYDRRSAMARAWKLAINVYTVFFSVLVGVVVLLVSYVLVGAIFERTRHDAIEMVALCLSLAVALSSMCVAFVLIRRDRTRELLQHLRHSRKCLCGYSLVGTKFVDGKLTCPECGIARAIELIALSDEERVRECIGPESQSMR